MLHVNYEAIDIGPGRLAEIDEARGRIQVRVARSAPLWAVVQQLNIEVDRFLATSDWFQLWKDEIISRGTADCSLRAVYLLNCEEPGGVTIRERRGIVRVNVDPALTTAEFAAAMNPATEQFLSGGQWFQMYAGEIIDMSPEPMSHV